MQKHPSDEEKQLAASVIRCHCNFEQTDVSHFAADYATAGAKSCVPRTFALTMVDSRFSWRHPRKSAQAHSLEKLEKSKNRKIR